MTTGVVKTARIAVSEFIEEIAAAATLAASAREVTFVARPVEEGLAVQANQQVLAAVIGNLLQNAFKFTQPHSTVTLRVRASTDRLLIEVEDECGGLAEADPNAPFPSFEQRGADRSGLGIGLAFSHWRRSKRWPAVRAQPTRQGVRLYPGPAAVPNIRPGPRLGSARGEAADSSAERHDHEAMIRDRGQEIASRRYSTR
jgi:anti-sigma regulatory factor (Ser/Thr protein kinase)